MKRLLSLLLALSLFSGLLGLFPAAAIGSASVPEVVGMNVSISTDFALHFYIRAPERATNVGAYIGEERVMGVRQEDGTYRVSYRHLTAKQMTDKISVRPFCRLSAQDLQGQTFETTIRDYAMSLLASDPPEELRRLCITMLNYGAKAQIYAVYNRNDLANALLDRADREVTVREYAYELARVEGEVTQSTAEFVGASLVLKNMIVFKMYINVEGQEDLRINQGAPEDEIVDGMTPAEEAAKLVEGTYLEICASPDFSENVYSYPFYKCMREDGEDEDKSWGYAAKTGGVYATEMSDVFYFRVVTEEGIGVAISYSVESYAAALLQTDSARNLVDAMMQFGDAAVAYEASLVPPAA